MKTQRKDSARTRERLLHAACEVFAASGFRDATIAEICRRAGANVAAVNYHFGSKENLYVEAWRHAFHMSLEAYPPDGGAAPDAPAEERLRGRLLSIMHRISDPENHEFEIVHKELANPTGLLTEVMRESIGPLQEGFEAVVAELLGGRATEQQVRLCQMSVKAMCFGPMLHERRRRAAPEKLPPPGPPPLEVDFEVLADHITRFTLGGIREIKRTLGKPRRRGGRAK